jgi:guanine deaminase
MSAIELIRGTVMHTTGNPVYDASAYVAFEDGGLLIEDGTVRALGEFVDVRAAWPHAPVTDWSGGYVLPGLVDAHVHFPQTRVIGRLGLSLLDWLELAALPEEARMAEATYARRSAHTFIGALASHGTTSANVFGAHFAPAVAMLFEAAEQAGIRVSAGLVVADRHLRADLHTSLESAYRDSSQLIRRFHGRGRLTYAVTPRFALSATEGLLDVCQTLMAEHPTVGCHTHINEQIAEVREVRALFPWAPDYLAIYERFGLSGRRSIFAHNVQATTNEVDRLAASGTSIAHCPCSNAALGSGIFPLHRHIDAGVRVALGTDIGGGTGFSLLKEGLQAHLMQRLAADPYVVEPAQLLYLATRAGAEALRLDDRTGDFSIGKAADLVYLRPSAHSVLSEALAGAEDSTQALSVLFTLAGQESVREVRVDGSVVYRSAEARTGPAA